MSHIRNHAAYHKAVQRNARAAFSSKPFKKFAKLQTKRFVRGATKFVNSGAATRVAGRYFGPEGRLVARAITGKGSYAIHHGSLFKGKGKGGHSHKHPSGHLRNGECRIEHSEFIGTAITAATSGTVSPFGSQAYQINPGNSGTFPWLSSLAINFSEWNPHKIVFEYRPLVSDSATSTTSGALTSMGSINMAVQYNVVQGPYVNKNTMVNSEGAVSHKPSHGGRIGIECANHKNPLATFFVNGALSDTAQQLVGTNATPPNTDQRFCDIGLFQIASDLVPVQADTPIALGEIWIHYDIVLLKPLLNGGLTNVLSSHYQTRDATPNTSPLGDAVGPLVPTINNYMTLVNITENTFSFPLAVTEGRFLVYYSVNGSDSAVTSLPVPSVNAAGTIIPMLRSTVAGVPPGTAGSATSADYNWTPVTGSNVNNVSLFFMVDVNAPGATLCTITIPDGTFPSGTVYVDLIVTPWNLLMQ